MRWDPSGLNLLGYPLDVKTAPNGIGHRVFPVFIGRFLSPDERSVLGLRRGCWKILSSVDLTVFWVCCPEGDAGLPRFLPHLYLSTEGDPSRNYAVTTPLRLSETLGPP